MAQNLRILHRTDPRIHFCKECGKQGTIKRSRSRNFTEKFLKVCSPLRTYRCKDCGWRGYKSEFVFRLASFKAFFFYLLLFLGTAFIVSFILKRFILK